MKLKQIFEALDKGSGIEKQKALQALSQAVDKNMKLIDFEDFKDVCKGYGCLISECTSKNCHKWILL